MAVVPIRRVSSGLCVTVCLILSAVSLSAAPLVIDSFEYTHSAVAQTTWVAQAGSPLVEVANFGEWGAERVMELQCNFSVQASRCYWDRTVPLDLTGYRNLALEIYVADPGAVSSFTLYFHSGGGWYGLSVPVTTYGWQTLYFPISEFSPEGAPSGWNQIDKIRLSPWKEASRDNLLAVRELRAFVPDLYIVRDDASSDQSTVDNVVTLHSDIFSRYNLSYSVISSSLVQGNYLAGSRMVILPYNDVFTEPMLQELERHVGAGGKLVAYYQTPQRIRTLLGIQVTSWMQGDFAAMTFSDGIILDLPSRVIQDSWNIMVASPTTQLNSRVIASWEDSAGQPTGKAAWLAGDNGLYLSHILLSDGGMTKYYMMLSLIGHYVPEVWSTAAAAEIARMGQIASYRTYNEAVAGIRTKAASTFRAPLANEKLAAAESARAMALAGFAAGNYAQAVQSADAVNELLADAYSLGQQPVTNEFRAVWEHSGTGPYPGNWAKSIDVLVSNGFNAVFPNMLWGGLAHYNSSLLPHSDEYNAYGDQITACVAAAHARGVQVHAWKVNWNLTTAPQSFIDSMRSAGRTQVSSSGQDEDWLCPSHPENLALERDSMMEVVTNYNVDGIHFDYIRYPDSDHCYCSGCHLRFETDSGLSVTNWPAHVLGAGSLRTSFLNWRRERITRLVQAVHAAVKAVKPQVKVSAAVFSDYPSAYDGVGQDWVRWIDLGIVDFLCPMDYTTDHDRFSNIVSQQLGYAAGRIPIYPGIGAWVMDRSGTICQILETRKANTGGFIIFNYDSSLAQTILPAVGAGTTSDDWSDSDGDFMPNAWEWVYGLNAANALDATLDADGDGMSNRAEYIAGTNPTDGASCVQCSVLGVQNGAFELVFQTVPGRFYAVKYCDNLLTTNWGLLTNNLPGTGGPVSVTHTNNASKGFYRVGVRLQ